MSLHPTAPLPSAATATGAARLRFGAALAVVLAAFWSTWWSFPGTWSENRTHGFLVAALCGFLIWRDRDQLSAEGAPVPLALVPLAGLSLVWMAATVMSVRVIHQAMVPALLVTWMLAARGQQAARAAMPIAGAFVLALPVWEILTWPLQLMAAATSGVALRAVGVDAVIRGETITIPSGSLIVADSCSGLGYFMTAVTISTVYALVYVRSWPIRRRVVLVAGAMAIVANWIRVFGLGVIADATRMQSPLMKEHEAYGWWIFAAVMALYFFLIPRLERQDRQPAQVDETSRAIPTSASAGIGPLVAGTVAALVGPLVYVAISAVPARGEPPALSNGLVLGGQWSVSTDMPPSRPGPDSLGSSSPAIPVLPPAFAGASEQRTAFLSAAGTTVRLDRFLYRQQGQGGELISAGNAVAADSVLLEDRTVGPLDANARVVRQAAIRDGQRVRLVWYWYRVADIETSSRAKAKLLELVAFATRHVGAEVVALSMPCVGTNCAEATRTLFQVATGRDMPKSAGP